MKGSTLHDVILPVNWLVASDHYRVLREIHQSYKANDQDMSQMVINKYFEILNAFRELSPEEDHNEFDYSYYSLNQKITTFSNHLQRYFNIRDFKRLSAEMDPLMKRIKDGSYFPNQGSIHFAIDLRLHESILGFSDLAKPLGFTTREEVYKASPNQYLIFLPMTLKLVEEMWLIRRTYVTFTLEDPGKPHPLCFLFRESTHQAENLKYRRKAQVKVRIKHRGPDLNDQIVNQLRQRCSSLEPLSFQHGTVRCNYVSPDRSFKTTVFANHQDQAVNVLQPICQIIQQPFDPAFLSVTSQRHRTSPTKRIQPLDGVPLNPHNYTDSFTLQLFKVTLLVNGLKKPILISKFSD
jgi:hypothetical protein